MNSGNTQYRFGFLDPGHFHAALVLREKSARIADTIVVYADPGPERDSFQRYVDAFNGRATGATDWQVEYRPSDLSALASDPNVDVVVLAGRNQQKLAQISALAQAGKHVFADKPWLTDASQTALIDGALSGPGFVMDIMTIRHEILTRLCHEIVNTESVFGGFAASSSDQPAIELAGIHHLYKLVNGQPLKRPRWYFDSRQQGDGIVDIQTHMIEQAMWLVADNAPVQFDQATVLQARRWPTPVDKLLFKAITESGEYPEAAQAEIDRDGILQYPCNGEITWALNDIVVRQRAEWREREPEGSGDMHRVVLRGNNASVEVVQGPETDFAAQVWLRPTDGSLENLTQRAGVALAKWRRRFTDLQLTPSEEGIRFDPPAGLDDGHESHFRLVCERFLDIVDRGATDDSTTARINTRYHLIAQAWEMANSSSES